MTARSTDASATADRQVAVAQFALLVRNQRAGVPSALVAAPIFGVALSQQPGPLPGFWLWALALMAMPVLFYLVIAPGHARLIAQDRFQAFVRLQLPFSVVFGGLWGMAAVLYFEPDPARMAVLLIALMGNLMTVSFATAAYLPSVYAFVLPLVLPFVVRALLADTALAMLSGAAALLVLVVVMAYVHQFNAALLASIRMRFDNERLLAETREALDQQTATGRDPAGHRPVTVRSAARVRRHRVAVEPADGRPLDGGLPAHRRRAPPGRVHARRPGGGRGIRQRVSAAAGRHMATLRDPGRQDRLRGGHRRGIRRVGLCPRRRPAPGVPQHGVHPVVARRPAGGRSPASTRRAPGAFAEPHVRLLSTFAAQAVIAIENVRLLNETLEARAAAETANEAKRRLPGDHEP